MSTSAPPPPKTEGTFTIVIKHRPWYLWLVWGFWLILDIFFLQNALASQQEHEPRAAFLYGSIFLILVLGGVIVWFIRRNRLS